MSNKKTLPETFIVNIYGIELNVYGYYYPYESETNAPDEIEIVDIVHESECIKDLLCDSVIEKIKTDILQDY